MGFLPEDCVGWELGLPLPILERKLFKALESLKCDSKGLVVKGEGSTAAKWKEVR